MQEEGKSNKERKNEIQIYEKEERILFACRMSFVCRPSLLNGHLSVTENTSGLCRFRYCYILLYLICSSHKI
jgi:hypothetical protein